MTVTYLLNTYMYTQYTHKHEPHTHNNNQPNLHTHTHTDAYMHTHTHKHTRHLNNLRKTEQFNVNDGYSHEAFPAELSLVLSWFVFEHSKTGFEQNICS